MNRLLFPLIVIIISSCSKSSATGPAVTPKSVIQWTFKNESYTGDSAYYLNGAYESFQHDSDINNVNEVLVFFSSADIKSGVYPVINGVFQTLKTTNCYMQMIANTHAYNSTGSSGSVTVINDGNISSITFSNVEMLADGSDSSMLNGNIVAH
jgi:hypothetical protein